MATARPARRPRGAAERRSTAARRPRPSPAETALARFEEEVLAAVEPRDGRGRRLTRVVRLAGGWVIFGVGVVFVILPVIPGMPLVILAAFMLAPDVPFFARVLDWGRNRFSHATTRITRVSERFTEDFHQRFTV